MSTTIEIENKHERKYAPSPKREEKPPVRAAKTELEARPVRTSMSTEAKPSVATLTKSPVPAIATKQAKPPVRAAITELEAKPVRTSMSTEAKPSVATLTKSPVPAIATKQAKPPVDAAKATKEAKPLSSGASTAQSPVVQDGYIARSDGELLRQAITEVPLIAATMNCEQALELFRQQPEHECAVVVDELRRPIGLLMRNALFIKLSVPLMRDLFSHRPVTRIFDANPLFVDLKSDVQHIVQQALSRTGYHLYDCVIVCDGAVVKGVLTMSNLLELSTALQNKLKQQQRTLIDSSQQSITSIVGEVAKVHTTVQASQQKFAAMVDMTLEGKNMLGRLTEAMSLISNNARQQQGLMEQLGHSASMIQKVSGLVQEISEQSNLLGINATIEAAHAGSYGRSFAVVAGEMMNLATETKHYAVQIKDTIEQMVNAINATKQHSEHGANLGKQSDAMIVNAEKIFQELFNMVAQSKNELKQIDDQAAVASRQAQMTMNELNKLLKLQK